MGEARQKELAAKQAPTHVQLTALQTFVVLQLDLACHCLLGIAHQLGVNLKMEAPANEIQKSIDHLQHFKQRWLAECGKKVVLATPADVPRVVAP